jgi:Transposase DDE domain group 1
VSDFMTDFIVKRLPYDLTSHAGLALVGQYLKRMGLSKQVDRRFPMRSGISNSDIFKSYLGLLCLGKNDFDAIESFRTDAFFQRSLALQAVPSSPTLRQRMDAMASQWFDLAGDLNSALLGGTVNGRPIDFGQLPGGLTPLDIDTFVMDNSGTAKELVGRTYAGVDGYCPWVAYLGTQGYCLELALRPGTQHSASESEYNFERVLPLAASLVKTPVLVRADSGFCSLKLMQAITLQSRQSQREMPFIIKWNPRSAPVEAIAAAKVADAQVRWCIEREGKRSCVWQETLDLPDVGSAQQPVRRIYRLCERTIDKQGHRLLLPEYVLEGWTTTLGEDFTPAQVMALYCDHATHEQFHSEFKTDMDLQRLPSGKFDTNYLVCQLAAVAMNLLRLIGQHTLSGPHAPVRHKAQRRRIRTVLQEMMYKAARLISHAGQSLLGLGRKEGAFTVFEAHYLQLRAT